MSIQTVKDFLDSAAACRKLATRARRPQRDQLLELAQLWEKLAADEFRRTVNSMPSPHRLN
jgi:ABC-type multidrug transport system ATPase subunit